MDPLTFFILIIAGIYFYSQGSIFFAFLIGILLLILILTSGGLPGSGSSHGGGHGSHGHAASLYPEKMTIEIGDIDHGSSGSKQLGEPLVNTAKFVANGIGSLFAWGKEKKE